MNLKFAISISALWLPQVATESKNFIPSQPGVKATAGLPLFEYESSHLHRETYKQMYGTSIDGDLAHLFSFDGGRTLHSGECRAFPGDDTWPIKREWDAFDDVLGGALIPTVPVAASCYHSWGVFDQEKCDTVIAGFDDPYFHEADPTSVMWPIWQGRTCLPSNTTNGTCTLGAYPSYAVNISSVSQIQLAINFARNANLRLVIKNTGHCYLGKSSGAGSLSVWTHHLKDISFLPHYEGTSYSGPALKAGAGVTVREVYTAAHENGVTVLGGICESVGFAGGYLTGGGHSPMDTVYGMAADQVLAFEVVTADGQFITADDSSHADLFWALRGGGGSTFGVVTSAIVRAHPRVNVVTSTFSFGTSDTINNDTFWLGIRAYFEQFIPFTDAGTYSWFILNSNNGSHQFIMMPFFAPNHTIASFEELVKPWFDRLRDLGINPTANTTYYDAFLPAYNDNLGIAGAQQEKDHVGGVSIMPGNRLFPRINWEDSEKFNATFDAIQNHGSAGHPIFGYHQAPRNRLNVDNAVSSAWRNAIAFLITSAPVPPDATSSQMWAAHEQINSILDPWREVAPASEGGGSYLNEAHVMEPDWQQNFYGEQYTELLRLKRKWDPKNVFYATTAVGSEEWVVNTSAQGIQTQDGRLCRL